jgi:hypothetical protein
VNDPLGQPSGGAVIVDDRLALFAALGWLPTDPGVDIVTTYGWQQRLLGAFVAPRATEGQLQRLAATLGASAATALEAGGDPDPALLTITDPRATAIDIARIRVAGANPLAAETIAAANQLGAIVRFSPRNGAGHVADHVVASGLDFAIWDPVAPT